MKTATAPTKAAEAQASWPDPSATSKGLLPKSLVAKREVRQFTIRSGVIGLVVVAAAALGWGAMSASAASVESAQHAQEAQNGALGGSVSRLKAIDVQLKAFDAQRANIAVALQNDVTYSAVVKAARAAAPRNVALTAIASQFGTVCPGPDPFNAKPAIGCLTLSGSASTVDDVTAYTQNIIKLSDDPKKTAWLVDPYATTASSGSSGSAVTAAGGAVGKVQFTLTVNFTPEALSMKYAKYLPGAGNMQAPATSGAPTSGPATSGAATSGPVTSGTATTTTPAGG